MPAAFYFAIALSVFLLLLFAARITAVKLFLKRVWSGIESTLHALGHFPSVVLRHIDKGLIWLSRPFLTRPAKTFRRHAPSWRWTVFLVWYAGIFAAAAYAPPPAAVAALALGIVGVVAINRAWVRNEKVRSKIGKKIDPDAESLDALAGHDLLDLEPAHPPSVSNKARNWYAPNRRARRRRGETPTSTRWPGSARPPSSASATSPPDTRIPPGVARRAARQGGENAAGRGRAVTGRVGRTRQGGSVTSPRPRRPAPAARRRGWSATGPRGGTGRRPSACT